MRLYVRDAYKSVVNAADLWASDLCYLFLSISAAAVRGLNRGDELRDLSHKSIKVFEHRRKMHPRKLLAVCMRDSGFGGILSKPSKNYCISKRGSAGKNV